MNDLEKRFGQLAVERGFITSDQHDRAMSQFAAAADGRGLSDWLVELGFITPSQATTIQGFVDREQSPNQGEVDIENLVGEVFGGCRIMEAVGTGGMGSTYRAHHERLDREVAVKILHPRLTRIGGMAERFQREARAAAKLSHPNIISVFDFDQRGSIYFMIMEFVDGRNLREVLEESGPLNLSEAIWITGEVLKGLTAAHDFGIVHRDIKPANVMLDEDARRVTIADFGTVRLLGASTSETLSTYGEILGTPQYMAPEQATADEVDGRTDLYGVGMMLFELLEGHPPFTGNSVVEVLEKHILQPLPKLSAANEPLQAFVERLTAKTKEDRFANAKEAGRRLDILYRRMCQGITGLHRRRDPSRSSGPEAPAVDSGSIETIATHLRHSQSLSLVAFESEEEASAPESAKADTQEVLTSALNGNLEKVLPEILEGDKAAELIPELLLLLWQNGRKDELLKLAPQLETSLPSVPAVPFFIGLAHAAQEDYEKARSAFSVAVGLDTSHVPAQIHLATCLSKLGRSAEAKEAMRRAALLNPNSVLAAVRYAEFLVGVVKDYRGAIAAYEKAIALAPDRIELRTKLGHVLCRLDRFEQAEAVAHEIVEWSGDEAEAAELRETLRKCREARASKTSARMPIIAERLPFEDEAAADPKGKRRRTRQGGVPPHIKPRLELMRLAVASGKWFWLRDIYRSGKSEYPTVSQFHIAFGQAALALDHAREALEAFETALSLKPDSVKAREGISKARAKLSE